MSSFEYSRELHDQVTRFIYREARLQDEHQYAEWEALWSDDGVYWVPANGEGEDPEREMSIIYDNRSRIALRVRQLMSGRRYAQQPVSRLRRLISNIEIVEVTDETLSVACNALVFESNARGETLWAARSHYRLQRATDHLLMSLKKVVLVNNDRALFTLAFLI